MPPATQWPSARIVATPLAPRSLTHVRRVTPKSSVDTPSRLMLATALEKAASDDGAVMATVGALTSVTRTASVADAVLPAASRAVTVSVLRPGLRATADTDHVDVPVATPLPP